MNVGIYNLLRCQPNISNSECSPVSKSLLSTIQCVGNLMKEAKKYKIIKQGGELRFFFSSGHYMMFVCINSEYHVYYMNKIKPIKISIRIGGHVRPYSIGRATEVDGC